MKLIRHPVCMLALLVGLAPAQDPRSTPQGGGVRLVYELPVDALQRTLQKKPKLDLEQLLARTVATLAARVGKQATVTRANANGFTVDVIAASAKDLRNLRQLIESVGTLEMRIVATSDYDQGGVRFDLDAEKGRLQKWLDDGGRERVMADPLAIDSYRAADPKHLRWVPHRLGVRPGDATRWAYPMTKVPQLKDATVAVYSDDDWNNGRVPASRANETEPFLIELVALNLHEDGFSQRDLDTARVRVTKGRNNDAAIAYSMIGARMADYANWSEKYINHCSAIVVNGELRSAPMFVSKIPGRGIIEGSFTADEAKRMVRALQTGALPTAPKLLRQEALPAGGK